MLFTLSHFYTLYCHFSERPTCQKCLESMWIQKYCSTSHTQTRHKSIPTDRLRDFIERKKLQV